MRQTILLTEKLETHQWGEIKASGHEQVRTHFKALNFVFSTTITKTINNEALVAP